MRGYHPSLYLGFFWGGQSSHLCLSKIIVCLVKLAIVIGFSFFLILPVFANVNDTAPPSATDIDPHTELTTQLQNNGLPLLQKQPVLRVSQDSIFEINLNQWAYLLKSTSATSLDKVLSMPPSAWRKLTTQDTQQIGAENMWVSLGLMSTSNDNIDRILSLHNPLLDRVELHHFINGELKYSHLMGDTFPFRMRVLLSNSFLYPFNLRPNERHQFLLKIDTQGTRSIPLKLWQPHQLTQELESRNLLDGLQIGTLLAVGLFSFFIAFATRSYSYGYYAGYVLGLALLSAIVHGVAFQYLWPDYVILQQYAPLLTIPIVLGFMLMFTEKVLLLKYNSVAMLRICRLLAVICFSQLFVVPFIPYQVAIYLLTFFVTLVCVVLAVFSIRLVIVKHKYATIYAIARVSLLIGSVLSGLIYLGIITTEISIQTPVLLGISLEVLVMGALLAIRYNDERKAKLLMQKQALEQSERLRRTRDESLKAEAEANERLEQMVQERTLELEITLRELSEVNQKLTEQTTIDSLTGVKNRGVFDKRLIAEGRISRRQQTPMALLMVDIDKFKAINDKFGHLGGDHSIKAVAEVLSDKLKRPTDLVSRFGGEEFAIILPNTDLDGAMLVAENMRNAVSQLKLEWENDIIPLTVSIGVSVSVIENDEHPTELLEHADKALYQAKRTGRNKVCRYDADASSEPE